MGLLQLQQGFTIINNFKLYSLLIEKLFCDSDSNESSLTLKPPKNLSDLPNEFNSFSTDVNNTPENVVNFNYLLKRFTDKSSLSLFHLNTCSLSKNIDDFEHSIQSAKTDFDTMTVSES